MQVTELDTPVATVDLDAVERNIARMQGYCDEHGLAFRPHIKTHKLPAIAHMQVRAGAVGITCQKLGEAEVMEAAGLDDILLTFPLIGAAKAERLAALAGEARVAVVGDSAAVVAGPLAGARRGGRRGRLPRRGRHGLQPHGRADGRGRRGARGARRLAPGPALRRPDDLPDAARHRPEAARARSTRSGRAGSRCAR